MIALERLSPYAERAGEPAWFLVGVSARRAPCRVSPLPPCQAFGLSWGSTPLGKGYL